MDNNLTFSVSINSEFPDATFSIDFTHQEGVIEWYCKEENRRRLVTFIDAKLREFAKDNWDSIKEHLDIYYAKRERRKGLKAVKND